MTPSAAASDMKMGMGTDHSQDPKKMADHKAAMALVAPGQATHVAKKSGSWFDRNTWEGGRIPGDNAKVLIKEGTSVTYDRESDARLFTLNVSGELKFSTNKNTKMVVDTFVVSSEGELEIGTKDNPVRAGVKTEILIADNGAINRKWDPKQFSRGLISHGDVQIHGQDKTSHLKVSKDPMAGDRTLTFGKAPINWQIGDTLVLTGTRFKGSDHNNNRKWNPNTEDEEVTIESIKGNRITLKEPLKFNHDTPRGDLKAYVANKTRNVVIASENGDNLAAQQRGHTMFMHSDDIDIRYAEFRDLGRTDKSKGLNTQSNVNGRYSVHVHQTGTDGDPAILAGNVVDGSPGWGMVSHDSSAIFENNFAYDIFGGAFVTETGNETGAFRNNISIKTDGIYGYNEKSGVAAHDFGKSGIGFWFAGRLVENEGNVAAGARNAGMFYMHRGSKLIGPNVKDLPFPDLGKERSADGQTVAVDQAPIQGFKDNEVLASSVGLHVVKDFPQQHHDLRTVLDGFRGWEVERGTQMQYTSHYTLNDFDLIGAKDSRFWMNDGVVLQKNTQEFVFNKMTVDGFKHGILQEGDLGFGGPPELSERGFSWIDLTLKNNEQELLILTVTPVKWL
ncbi:MAG: G8 domain-containing protein [Cyanobacteria bacterium J06555_13]